MWQGSLQICGELAKRDKKEVQSFLKNTNMFDVVNTNPVFLGTS